MDEEFIDADDPRMVRIGERFGRLAVSQFERYFALSHESQQAVDRMAVWCHGVEAETGKSANVMLTADGMISVHVDLSEPSPWLIGG